MLLVSGATKTVAKHADHPNLGQLMRPGNGNVPTLDYWAADNGAFCGFDADGFLGMLERLSPMAKWVAAPDVVGDWRATTRCFEEWEPKIRELGFSVAYVLQDGCQEVPWARIECLFVGGTTEYKLSAESAAWIAQAKERDKLVHVGRVNSVKRMRWCFDRGVDSIDGTQVSMFPGIWLFWTLEILRWFETPGMAKPKYPRRRRCPASVR